MKIEELIKELVRIQKDNPDIEVYFQDTEVVMNKSGGIEQEVFTTDEFFILVEEYEDGPQVNIRSWPY